MEKHPLFRPGREESPEQERLEDWQRLEHYRLTGVSIPHEKVAAWLEQLAQGKNPPCPIPHDPPPTRGRS